VSCGAAPAKADDGCIAIRRSSAAPDDPAFRRFRKDTTMKRAFVFLLLAPISLFCMVLFFGTDATDTKSLGIACVVGMVLAVLSLPMAAIGAAVDGYLAPAVPVGLRACLTAGVGATVATAESLALFSTLLSPSILMAFTLGGALVSAASSLLSNDYSGRQGRWPELVGA
jgi:hypothetical protein